MTKSKKYLNQFQSSKKGIELFFQLSKECQNYAELQELTDTLACYFHKVKNDKAPNRHLVLFQNFIENEQPKKRNIETMKRKKISKNTKKKSSYLDYISEFQILRNRGLSHQMISEYSEEYFQQKVSRETIRKILLEIAK